ncbi:hypothetical protein MMC34_000916 [Xylographa carneopallida]|nr:hypothetical protein [Xylographa carneopallida]
MSAVGKQDQLDQEKAVYSHLIQESESSSIEDVDDDTGETAPNATRNRVRHYLSITIKGLVLLLAIWGIASLGQRLMGALNPPLDPQKRSCSCGGTTTAEAIRRGCIFTPLAIAWLPPHCIDIELSDEFDISGPGPGGSWEYWADSHRQVALNRTEMGLLADTDGVFYTTQDWHIKHCTFTWRKHYQQRVTGVTIERRSNGLDHIGHCETIFRVRGGLTDIQTVAGIALDADDAGDM